MVRREHAAGALVIDVTRVFDAPRELVFSAWTQKKHLDRWSAPKEFTIPFSEGDFRPGGIWRCCMRAPDGAEHWVSGVYREIVPNERLVFTHGWEVNGVRGHETVVTVEFFDQGGRTRMEFRQEGFETVASRDGHAGGWAECFDLLEAQLHGSRV